MSQQQPAHDPFGRPAVEADRPDPSGAGLPPDAGGGAPGAPEVEATLASRWSRLGGAIVDWLVVFVPLAVLFDLLTPYTWNDDGDDWNTVLALYGFALAFVVVFFVYNVVLLTRSGEHRGQTLGKQIAGTWVAGEAGTPMTTRDAVKRELGRGLLGVIPIMSTIEVLTIFFKRRQTLHDLTGSTVVLGAVANDTAYGSLPGWYPDPAGTDELRWWDGRTWSATTSPAPDVQASSTAPSDESETTPTVSSSVAAPASVVAASPTDAWQTAASPISPPAVGDAHPLASRGRRFVARLVDLVVVGGPLVFLWFVAAALCYDDYGYMRSEASDVLFAIASIVLVLAYVLYMTLMPARKGARNGQTWGKQLLDVRVVRETGAPLSPGSAFLRELLGVQILGFVPFYAIADAVTPFCNPRRQALHDMMASTLVIGASEAPTTVAFPAATHAAATAAGASVGSPLGAAQPAGWYADPAAAGSLRWWDGHAWTDHTQPVER